MEVAYRISKNNLHIVDGGKVEDKHRMREILFEIQYMNPESDVGMRSKEDLSSEGKAHNRLYKGGIFKSRTKDVDLEYPIKKCLQFIYNILGGQLKRT